MLNDPAGLLNRMPELEAIARDVASIRTALESGDPFKLYRALRWASWTGRLGAHAAVARELLGNRRLFARPLTGSPGLFTMNSFGLGFVGESERDARDGTYVTLHAIVALFKVPLLPLGAYLVGPGDTDSSYRIFARVPLGGFTWAWSRLSAAAAALLVLSGAYGAVHASRFAKVHVANGFAKPLEVQLADQHVTVAPGSTTLVEVPVGTQPAKATIGGTVVDEGPIDAETGFDAFVWNVGGVSAVLRAEIDYWAVTPMNAPSPQPTFFCGQRLVREKNVNFLFREPDQTVSMSKGTTKVTRTLLTAVWRKPGDDHAPCLDVLANADDKVKLSLVAQVLAKAGELEGLDEVAPIVVALLAHEDEGQWEQARALFDKRTDLETGRMMLWVAEETGHFDEARQKVTSQCAAHPDDPDLAALQLRAGDAPPSSSEVEAVLARFPENDSLRASAQFAAFREGKHERSLQLWLERLRDTPDACTDAALAAQAALPLHREDEVLKSLESCSAKTGGLSLPAAVAGAKLLLAQKKDAKPWLAKVEDTVQRQRASLLCKVPLGEAAQARVQAFRSLVEGVDEGSEAVFSRLSAVEPDELIFPDTELGLLVWAEALRTHHASAKTFERRLRLRVGERKAIEAFIAGTAKEQELARLLPLERAVAFFVRSRADGVAADEKARLTKRAREEAPLGTLLASAVEHWR